jgi:UDP-glucuronate 4-epimerase
MKLNFPHAESIPCLASSDDESSGDDHLQTPENERAAPHVDSCGGLAALVDADDASRGAARRATALLPHVGPKKVLVTGGAGFVGSATAARLLERGDAVVIVDEMNDYYDVRLKEDNLRRLRTLCPDEARLVVYRGDICDEEFMLALFERERPAWVCHMAARAGVRPSIEDPYVYIHSNIRGTTHLMELSHRFGVQNFVFASSSSVYGGSKSTLFSEDESVDNPVSPYAAVSFEM